MRRRCKQGHAAARAAACFLAVVCATALTPGLFAGPVFAQAAPLATAPAAAVQATPARAPLCAACHGPKGNSAMPDSPSLAAQPRLFIENTLVMIREGVRKIPAMQGLLNGVPDQEIIALSRYFAAQTLVPVPGARQPERFGRGQALAARTHCASCHLPSYAGREQMPRLAGQREDYLFHSMKQFVDGSATGRDTIMAASLHGMSEEDLRDLAHYLAQFP